MKNLILINGTMGVGKSTTGKALMKLLPNCVFLDGDWCWYSVPMICNEETYKLADQNISYCINNFLSCESYENIVFCAVMFKESNITSILSKLTNTNYNLFKFSLMCSESALAKRLEKDTDGSFRGDNIVERALRRLPDFLEMDTTKIDVSDITPEQAANKMCDYINKV